GCRVTHTPALLSWKHAGVVGNALVPWPVTGAQYPLGRCTTDGRQCRPSRPTSPTLQPSPPPWRWQWSCPPNPGPRLRAATVRSVPFYADRRVRSVRGPVMGSAAAARAVALLAAAQFLLAAAQVGLPAPQHVLLLLLLLPAVLPAQRGQELRVV